MRFCFYMTLFLWSAVKYISFRKESRLPRHPEDHTMTSTGNALTCIQTAKRQTIYTEEQPDKTIYILLTRSNTFLSRLIAFITSDSYTHVSMSFDEELYPLYSSARKNGWTLVPAGPCKEYLHKGYLSHHLDIPCCLYELKVKPEIYNQALQEAERILRNEQDYHYNFAGLLLCQLGIVHTRKYHYFCSQFTGEILRKSGALTFPKHTSLLKPMDYTRMPELKFLYKGTLRGLLQEYAAYSYNMKPDFPVFPLVINHLRKAHRWIARL